MDKYRKRPVVVEAEKFTGFNDIEGVCNCGAPAYGFHVHTLEGPLKVSQGDWIVKGIKGEIYPVRADIFRLLYEPDHA